MAETTGLLNRRTGNTVPGVRIPLSPPSPTKVLFFQNVGGLFYASTKVLFFQNVGGLFLCFILSKHKFIRGLRRIKSAIT